MLCFHPLLLLTGNSPKLNCPLLRTAEVGLLVGEDVRPCVGNLTGGLVGGVGRKGAERVGAGRKVFRPSGKGRPVVRLGSGRLG